jgi:phage tail sheath gpL-like
MAISATSLAAANAVGVRQTKFANALQNVPHKNLIVANYDETSKTGIVENQLYQAFSAEGVGAQFGFGFDAHRLASASLAGSDGTETWVLPVKEAAAAVAATGTFTVTVTTAIAGIAHIWIGDTDLSVIIEAAATDAEIATAIQDAINADDNLPVTAVAALGVVTVTSKQKNISANDIFLNHSLGVGQELPGGVSIAIVDMASGAGIMLADMKTALETALGTGDSSNNQGFTELAHGFGADTTVLDDISTYNGAGDTFSGCWAKLVHKPMRSFTGDVTAGSGGFTAATTLGDGRRELDRTSGQVCVPGSVSHPNEIAALTLGIMSRVNQDVPVEHFVGVPLPGVMPGALTDDWTSDYDQRDQAVKAGISPTLVVGSTVYLQDVVTFFHPVSVAPANNIYRSQVQVSKWQNILDNYFRLFDGPNYKGQTLVSDVNQVTDPLVRPKVKDANVVMGDLVQFAKLLGGAALVYSSAWIIEKLQKERATRLVLRTAADGFDILYPLILSGEARFFNTTIEADASIAAI